MHEGQSKDLESLLSFARVVGCFKDLVKDAQLEKKSSDANQVVQQEV